MLHHQHDIIEAMLQPGFYPEPTRRVRRRETHISTVLLTDQMVYKIKKPLNLGFLDFTTLELRRHYCHQEIILNRRLSPSVYLGVVPITFDGGRYWFNGPGQTVEVAVQMRRLEDDRSFLQLLKKHRVSHGMLIQVVDRLVDFYRMPSASGPSWETGGWKTVWNNCEENFIQLVPFVDVLFSAEYYEPVRLATRAMLVRRRRLFDNRTREGKVRDCHGDLRAEHIYFDQGVQIIDCIEFNDRFRYSDVTADLAFLAMDLDFSGFTDTAQQFIDQFAAAFGDTDLYLLLDFYKCYRAMVRIKVDCFRTLNDSIGSHERARLERQIQRYMQLAYGYVLKFVRPTIWVVFGLPASGKSTIATALAHHLMIESFNSDRIRKQLYDLDPTQSGVADYGSGIYTHEATSLTYGKLMLSAQQVVKAGNSVILDAQFGRRNQRREAVRLAEDVDANVIFIECRAPDKLLVQRLAARQEGSVSDARRQHLSRFKSNYEAPTEIEPVMLIQLDTSRPLQESIRRILAEDHVKSARQIQKRLK
jgi:aminoglycoside phosphotransferase family enzyme/predicted kinase